MADRVRPARSQPTPQQEEMMHVADEGAATQQATAGAQAAAQNFTANKDGHAFTPTEVELESQAVGGRRVAHPELQPSSDQAHGHVTQQADPMATGQSNQAKEAANKSGEGTDEATARVNRSAGQQDDAVTGSAQAGVNQGAGQRTGSSGRDRKKGQ